MRKQQRLILRQVLGLGALGDIWLRRKEALEAADGCMQRVKYLDACLRVSMAVERRDTMIIVNFYAAKYLVGAGLQVQGFSPLLQWQEAGVLKK